MRKEKEKFSTFGKILKLVLTMEGLSQSWLADRLGLARPTIATYISGRSEPSLSNLCKIADILDVSTDYLLGRCGKEVYANDFIKSSQSKYPDLFDEIL